MTSQVEICNLALANIGKQGLVSSLEEASTEALYCKLFYSQTLDVLLSAYPWSFAGATQSLAALAINPKEDLWQYAYAKPTDCLKIRRILDEDMTKHIGDAAGGTLGSWPYWLEAGLIYSSMPNAYVYYTRRETDPTRYSALFVETLSWHLSVRLAMPLTRDGKMRADANAIAQQTLALAGAHDANESVNTAGFDPEMLEARR